MDRIGKIKRVIEPLDSLANWGTGLISNLITLVTGGGPSHMRLYLGDITFQGHLVRHALAEATLPHVQIVSLDDLNPSLAYQVGRYKWRDERRAGPGYLDSLNAMLADIWSDAEAKEGYDILELPVHLLQITGVLELDISNRVKRVCSSKLDEWMGMVDMAYCPWDPLPSPADQLRSPLYVAVKSLGLAPKRFRRNT
jgi:hypothetical protein